MGVENLNKIFNPKSIAVVGASEKKESVGYKLLYNMINAGYKGDIHPVNPGKDMIQGFHAYPSVKDIRMIALVESLGFQVKYRGSEAFVTLKLR